MCLIIAMTKASGLETWVKGSVALNWRASPLIHYREVQRDRVPTGSLKLNERRRSQRGLKYPIRTLVGETLGPWRGGQGPIGSQLGKELIESGMFSDGSDTIPGHVLGQGTQLRS